MQQHARSCSSRSSSNSIIITYPIIPLLTVVFSPRWINGLQRGHSNGICGRLSSTVRRREGENEPNGTADFSSQILLPEDVPYSLPRSEEARRYFRTVYDFPQWERHRSQYRLIDRLLQIPQSHIMQNILPSIAWCTSVAALVAAYMHAYDSGMLPGGFVSISPNRACSAFVNTTTVALSLLLVFRTNASYARWDEARKMQGMLVNRSRDLARQACTMFPRDDPEAKVMLARWTVVFARMLRIHFQPEAGTSVETEVQGLVSAEELQLLKEATHRPVRAIQVLSHIIYDTDTHPVLQAQMCQNLTAFQDVLGGCERLLRAPIPVSYTRHTARFLFMWLTLLPFALYSSCDVWTIPVVAGVSAVLCGIEEIGVQVEEPFGILPLEVICDRIHTDVMSTLKEEDKTRLVIRRKKKEAAVVAGSSESPAGDSLNGSHAREESTLQ